MMKKVWKRALACILVLALVAGYFPTRMNQVVNAEDSDAQQETTLEFGKTDTYLQLSNPLSAAPQAIEATVNMPEIEKEWVLCAAEDIAFEKGTATDSVPTTDGTETVEPVAGTSYAQVQLTNAQEFLFSKKFDVTIPYTYSNDDVALSFWMYSDTAVTIDAGFIELTSSGTNDHNERCWGFSSNYSGNLALKTGWNYVELPVSKMIKGCTDADFNLQEANYIRWHSTKFSSIADDSTITIGLTDMKLVVIEEENYGNYADGEWTIADVDGTIPIEAIGQSSVSKPEAGSNALEVAVTAGAELINQKFVSSMTIPADYKLTGTASTSSISVDGTVSGEDADNLYVDFWLYAPTDSFKAWFRLYDDTTEILRYGLSNVSVQQGWNHIQIPFSSFIHVPTSDCSDFSILDRLTIAAYSSAGTGTYYLNNIKIIDTDILETFATTIVSASNMASTVQKAEVADGTINYAEMSATGDDTRVNIQKENIVADLSAYQLEDLALEFWMKSAVAKTITIDDSSNYLRLGTSTLGSAWENANQRLVFNSININLKENEWTKVTLPLKDAVNGGSLTSSTEFTWLRFLMKNLGEGTTISISDMSIVEMEKEETSEITIISASDIGSVQETKVSDGTINYVEKTAAENNGKYRVDIQKTTIAADLSAHQLEDLALEFWMKSNVDKTIAVNDSSNYLRLGTGALGSAWEKENQRLVFKDVSIDLKANEWMKVTLPLKDAVNAGNLTSSAEFTWLRFLMMDLGQGTLISISDMKLVDWSSSVTESTYDATNLNYMIFSNLNAESETTPIALMVTKEGNPTFVWDDTQYTLNQNICTGTDVNLRVVRNSNGYIVFCIDDVMVGMNLSKTSLLEKPTTAHCIGGDAAGGQIFNGSISNLKVYSDATLSTCIGNWALSGNIQNVNATMSDSSDYENTAVFCGSRADDWSDYTVPEEIKNEVCTLVSAHELSIDGTIYYNETTTLTESAYAQTINYKRQAAIYKNNDHYRIDYSKSGLSVDLSAYKLDDLAVEFWMKASNTETTTLSSSSFLQMTNSDSELIKFTGDAITLQPGEWKKVTLNLKDATTNTIVDNKTITGIRFLVRDIHEGEDIYVSDIKIVNAKQPWSLVYIPDIENLTSNDASNDTYKATWETMAQWIANNAETENIQHVIGGGDTTKNNSEEEYARAMEGYQLFMNDVSWSTMIGYNDYEGNYNDRVASNYQTTFSDTVIKASAASETYIGSYEDAEKITTENSYYRFSVNGVKWMILQLEYAPREDVLVWADGIAKEYPLDNIILTTPGYLDGYGAKLTIGKTVWNALSNNQNIKMILCGHSTNGTGAIAQATETYSDGNGAVPVLMMNAQDLDADDDAYYTDKPLGMISILRFSADGTKAAVQYYSPTEGKSFSPKDTYGDRKSNSIELSYEVKTCTPKAVEYAEGFKAGEKPTDSEKYESQGYIFAGWFTDEACTTALKKSDNVTKAYAKFVDAEVLSVKAQSKLDKNTKQLPAGETDVRFVTTVDSTKYKEVGFKITVPKDSVAEGKDNVVEVGSQNVYEYLYAVGMAGTGGVETLSYTPSGEFSPQSILFKTFTVTGIPEEKYGVKFTVQAYWITQDGTTVYGAEVSKTAEDGEP